MRFLMIDDCPGRYDEFTRLLDKNGDSWVITFNYDIVWTLLCHQKIDVIMLDHDMPIRNGREWAKWFAETGRKIPVIVASTTSLPNAREEMLNTLTKAGIRAIINPADHSDCEKEWYWWAKGVAGG